MVFIEFLIWNNPRNITITVLLIRIAQQDHNSKQGDLGKDLQKLLFWQDSSNEVVKVSGPLHLTFGLYFVMHPLFCNSHLRAHLRAHLLWELGTGLGP